MNIQVKVPKGVFNSSSESDEFAVVDVEIPEDVLDALASLILNKMMNYPINISFYNARVFDAKTLDNAP